MRKKPGFTFIEQAIVLVSDLEKIYRARVFIKPTTLDGAEFLRRFCKHILPQRFVKIRRFGIYNHTARQNYALRFAIPALPGKGMPGNIWKVTKTARILNIKALKKTLTITKTCNTSKNSL